MDVLRQMFWQTLVLALSLVLAFSSLLPEQLVNISCFALWLKHFLFVMVALPCMVFYGSDTMFIPDHPMEKLGDRSIEIIKNTPTIIRWMLNIMQILSVILVASAAGGFLLATVMTAAMSLHAYIFYHAREHMTKKE